MTAARPGVVLGLHLGVLALLAALQLVLPPFHHTMVARIMLLGAYAVGYNLLLGYAGLMSLGHALFFSSGLYGAGLSVYYGGVGPGPAFLAGLGLSLVAALAVGVVALRTTGVAFLIVTLMLAQAFYLATLHFNEWTLGDQGLILTGRLAPIRVGGWELGFAQPAVKYNVAWLILAGSLLLTLGLVRSPIGRVLVALRENDERTRLLGYNTYAYKFLALGVSGGLSGAAGAGYALLFSYVGSSFADILYSIYPLLWTLVGGAGTVLGPLVGVALMTYAVDVASDFTSSYLIVVGAVLLALVLWAPAGLLGAVRARWLPWLP